MGVVINGGTAGVHTSLVALQGLKLFYLFGSSIEKSHMLNLVLPLYLKTAQSRTVKAGVFALGTILLGLSDGFLGS